MGGKRYKGHEGEAVAHIGKRLVNLVTGLNIIEGDKLEEQIYYLVKTMEEFLQMYEKEINDVFSEWWVLFLTPRLIY